MTPTERKRIETEAEAFIRIEKEAEAYADSIDRRGCAFWQGMYRGYIAGATSEHDKARNQAIEIIKELVSSIEGIHENWITPNARYWGSQTNDDVEDAVDKANKFIEQ